jgi:hypothetical protein
MRRGTTCVITFSIPFDSQDIEILNIAFSQKGKIVLEWTEKTATLAGESIIVSMTEADTLKLSGDSQVLFQIRVKMKDGRVLASNIMQSSVDDILKDGELK